MPVFAVFDQAAYYGCCPNVSGTPPSSPLDKGAFRLHADCSCHDASFGGVIDLPPLNDDTESFPKARGETRSRCRSSQRWKQPRVPTEQRPPGPQGSVQARLDAFLAGKGASRAGAHATETGAGSGWAWLSSSDNVSFISDGVLSMAVQGTAQGLLEDSGVLSRAVQGTALGLEDSGEDGLTGAEVRRLPRGWRAHKERGPPESAGRVISR